MKPQLRHIKTEVIPPWKYERPPSHISESINQPHYVKLIPLGVLVAIILGVLGFLYIGAQVSMESHRATVAQAEAIGKQAEAIERQTAVIEGMSERRQSKMSGNTDVKDLMIFIAVVLGVVAAIKCVSD